MPRDINARNTNPANRTGQTGKATAPTVHFYILLDRSGSMASMRGDVIGGYNNFIQEQKAVAGKARVTLVQFDSQNPQEVIFDAVRLDDVPELTARTFVPRGGTPLLDATGALIETVLGRAARRKVLGKAPEEIVFVTVTDGEENQSAHTGLDDVRRLIGAGKEEGWSFVYLGAGLDAYGEAGRLGYDSGSTQGWIRGSEGAEKMWGSLSRAAGQLRRDVAGGVQFDKSNIFRGIKEAEEN